MRHVDRIISAMGFAGALVSDESTFMDFAAHCPPSEEDHFTLDSWAEALDLSLRFEDRIYAAAERLRMQGEENP